MGRRRKPGARSKSGRLSRAYKSVACDHGTAEGQRNRHHLINGAPVELAGSALGVLQANAVITIEQAAAGTRYMILRGILFGGGRPDVMSDLTDPYGGRVRDDDELAEIRERFERRVARLEPEQKAAVDRIVIGDRLPTWFRMLKLGQALRPVDEAEREALLGGLAARAGLRR